jgi:8-oxo-dGTP pyrophosphatase MutT (NUDIX family)
MYTHLHDDQAAKSRIVFKGFVTLTEEEIPTSKGPYPYVTVHTRPSSVIIIPMRSDGTWLVTHEWRHSVHHSVYSFPGGLVDEREAPLEAARRELLEETGYTSDRFVLLGECFPLPGLLNQKMSVFVASDIVFSQTPVFHEVETISFAFYPPQEVGRLFGTSSDIDAMALAALGMMKARSLSLS